MSDTFPMRDLRPCDGCGGALTLAHGLGVFRRVTVETFGIGPEVHRGMGAVQMMGGSLALADAMGMLPDLVRIEVAAPAILCGTCFAKMPMLGDALEQAEEARVVKAAETKRRAQGSAGGGGA